MMLAIGGNVDHMFQADKLWSVPMFCCLFNFDTRVVECTDVLRGQEQIPEIYRLERKDNTKAYLFYRVLNETVDRWCKFSNIGASPWREVHVNDVPAEVRLAKELV